VCSWWSRWTLVAGVSQQEVLTVFVVVVVGKLVVAVGACLEEVYVFVYDIVVEVKSVLVVGMLVVVVAVVGIFVAGKLVVVVVVVVEVVLGVVLVVVVGVGVVVVVAAVVGIAVHVVVDIAVEVVVLVGVGVQAEGVCTLPHPPTLSSAPFSYFLFLFLFAFVFLSLLPFPFPNLVPNPGLFLPILSALLTALCSSLSLPPYPLYLSLLLSPFPCLIVWYSQVWVFLLCVLFLS